MIPSTPLRDRLRLRSGTAFDSAQGPPSTPLRDRLRLPQDLLTANDGETYEAGG